MYASVITYSIFSFYFAFNITYRSANNIFFFACGQYVKLFFLMVVQLLIIIIDALFEIILVQFVVVDSYVYNKKKSCAMWRRLGGSSSGSSRMRTVSIAIPPLALSTTTPINFAFVRSGACEYGSREDARKAKKSH